MDYAQDAKSLKETPILNRLVDQIEKATINISEAAGRLEYVRDRLLNSEPLGIGGTPEGPVPQETIEGKLKKRLAALETLGARLHEISNRFERAV